MDFGSDGLEQMYQEVILEASRARSGSEHFAPDLADENADAAGTSTFTATHEYCVTGQSHQFNPTCGDEVTLRVELTDGSDGKPTRIEKLTWDGHGCSISQASLSIMHDMVEGRTVDEAMHLSGLFHRLMESRGKGLDSDDEMDELDDAVAFQGASKFPMRIKCALLGWDAMKASVAQAMAHVRHGADGAATPAEDAADVAEPADSPTKEA
ncbi:MAG: SUF system NifU family Fe-S cluster assembly protein [Bifidobacteriaceae bacterium]|nr:SUF system NifU family Fe-S cluster assembly protein [Bifidobacteriaceae bacterium]